MKDDLAIAVRNVSKRYRLYRTPLDRLVEALPWSTRPRHDEFWALRDVSFDVPRGATLGILGRNGSGKSTLLQILFSILQPTTGTATCQGKVAALLELGAGFNPAFTGRANLMLHGATLGLSRRECLARIPAIEEFAEIGPFLDQPVKTYSSGMFVRLAFAAAISDDPDVLIVDEALAVGDARFQQKCYGKFLEFQQRGKTILLVTHDTQAVIKHCDQALLLEQGRLVMTGAPREAVNCYYELLFTGKVSGYSPVPTAVKIAYKKFNIVHYRFKHYALAEALGPLQLEKATPEQLAQLQGDGLCAVGATLQDVKRLVDQMATARVDAADLPAEVQATPHELFCAAEPVTDGCPLRPSYSKNERRFGDRRAEIVDYLVVGPDGEEVLSVSSGEEIELYLKVRFHHAVERPMAGFALKSVDGLLLYGTNHRLQDRPSKPASAGEVRTYKFRMRVALAPGDVFLDLGLAEMLPTEDHPIDVRYGVVHLRVHRKERFAGLINLEADMQEIARAGAGVWTRELVHGS